MVHRGGRGARGPARAHVRGVAARALGSPRPRLLILGGNLLVIVSYIVLCRQALLVADIAAPSSPVLGLPGSHGYWAIAAACTSWWLATASISVRVALFGPEALPKPNPEEMPT